MTNGYSPIKPFLFWGVASRRLASRRLASRRLASPRLASPRLASSRPLQGHNWISQNKPGLLVSLRCVFCQVTVVPHPHAPSHQDHRSLGYPCVSTAPLRRVGLHRGSKTSEVNCFMVDSPNYPVMHGGKAVNRTKMFGKIVLYCCSLYIYNVAYRVFAGLRFCDFNTPITFRMYTTFLYISRDTLVIIYLLV